MIPGRLAAPPALAVLLLGLSAAAPSQRASANDADGGVGESITVTADPSMGAAALNPALVPAQTTSLDAADLAQRGAKSITGALAGETAGVSLGDATGNPNQPALYYHGFAASPLAGTTQGLAVYRDGVRLNQPFGDTVDWDLLPPGAIARIDLEGANPVFGLNALGGAVALRSRSGFDGDVTSLDVTGGSFTTIDAQGEIGRDFGNTAIFTAARVQHQDGWRDGQSSDIHSIFSDIGARADNGEYHLRLSGALNDLNAPGPSPVQLLARDPAAAFTLPNLTHNAALGVDLSASHSLGAVHLSTVLYWRYLQTRIVNGNAPNDTPCAGDPAYLCSQDGTPSTGRGGLPIAAFRGALPYGELDLSTTNTNAYGGSLQISGHAPAGRMRNSFAAGLAYDGGSTLFSATPLIGGLDPLSRAWTAPGVVIDEPGQTGPARVGITSNAWGLFATDTLQPLAGLALTLSARLNHAAINLDDQQGGLVSGAHEYTAFNPAAGLTYKIGAGISAYGGAARTNRTPTPAELSCASPQAPCSLANFFVADPALKQVQADTLEAGLRGHWRLAAESSLRGEVALFRTDARDDIAYLNAATSGRAYFANIGTTRREGLTARATLAAGAWTADLSWAMTEAYTRAGYGEPAGNNPAADANGDITVLPGARLPGIPRHRINAAIDWQVDDALRLGADLDYQGDRVLVGDEANLTPRLGGAAVLGATLTWQVRTGLSLILRGENLLDRGYARYGTFAPIGDVPVDGVFLSDPRSLSPAAPRALYATLRASF